MRKISEVEHDSEMVEEYDLSLIKGERGKYAGRAVTHAFTIELEEKPDGQWIAEITAFAVQASGQTREEAISKVQGLAFRILAERIEQGKSLLGPATISFSVDE
jgi:predicted RNase H-like HicB family nuclease